MRYAFISGLISGKHYLEILEKNKSVMQFAADALQKSYIEAIGKFVSNTNFQIFNLPYIGSYPKRSRIKRFYKDTEIYKVFDKSVLCHNVPFWNISGYKLISRYYNLYKSLRHWAIENSEDKKCVFIYAMHAPFLLAACKIKHKYSETKIILIVPDIPQFMNEQTSYFRSIISSLNRWILFKKCNEVDGFILLTQQMQEILPVKNKPKVVIEGMYNSRLDDSLSYSYCLDKSLKGKKIVLYSGTLAKRYGIMNLLNAFMLTKNNNYRLLICGDGNAKEDVVQMARIDPRIIYLGTVERNKVLSLQRLATLLVNPRTSAGEYTKYSFPSKIMEYYASGTPVLMYQLPGIPKEYYRYCFSLKEDSVQTLSNQIESILSISDVELKKIGCKARNFILENKTPQRQAEKIYNLINII